MSVCFMLPLTRYLQDGNSCITVTLNEKLPISKERCLKHPCIHYRHFSIVDRQIASKEH